MPFARAMRMYSLPSDVEHRLAGLLGDRRRSRTSESAATGRTSERSQPRGEAVIATYPVAGNQ